VEDRIHRTNSERFRTPRSFLAWRLQQCHRLSLRDSKMKWAIFQRSSKQRSGSTIHSTLTHTLQAKSALASKTATFLSLLLIGFILTLFITSWAGLMLMRLALAAFSPDLSSKSALCAKDDQTTLSERSINGLTKFCSTRSTNSRVIGTLAHGVSSQLIGPSSMRLQENITPTSEACIVFISGEQYEN